MIYSLFGKKLISCDTKYFLIVLSMAHSWTVLSAIKVSQLDGFFLTPSVNFYLLSCRKFRFSGEFLMFDVETAFDLFARLHSRLSFTSFLSLSKSLFINLLHSKQTKSFSDSIKWIIIHWWFIITWHSQLKSIKFQLDMLMKIFEKRTRSFPKGFSSLVTTN